MSEGGAEDTTAPRLVLASGSPRRRQLLEQLGVQVEVRPTTVDESPLAGEAPVRLVERLARAKAMHRVEHGELVLAADTIVVLDGDMLGKPSDDREARVMLRRLSAREHEVLTGVAIADVEHCESSITRTRVRFLELSDHDIDWYVASGEPGDKAGAYAVQGVGALFVEGIEGNYSNVVGLPLPEVRRLLDRMGLDLLHGPVC